MSTATDAAELLEKAADLIENGGHLRGHLSDGKGAHCAAGAINMAQTKSYHYPTWVWSGQWRGGGERGEVQRAAYEAVADHLDLGNNFDITVMDAVVDWNNKFGRTGTEVIDAFRHAAKNLRNEAAPA